MKTNYFDRCRWCGSFNCGGRCLGPSDQAPDHVNRPVLVFFIVRTVCGLIVSVMLFSMMCRMLDEGKRMRESLGNRPASRIER